MLHTAINRARRSGQAGFTLIELLIVIVILGVLAAIVVFSVTGITKKGDVEACKAQISSIDTAYEAAVAQGSSATNIEDLYAKKIDGSAGLALLHGRAPAAGKNTIDGNDFAGNIAISTVDGYAC